MPSNDHNHITLSFTPGRTRATARHISVSFHVPVGASFSAMVDSGTAPAAPPAVVAATVVNANDLPREALKLDKFEGRPSDRRFQASTGPLFFSVQSRRDDLYAYVRVTDGVSILSVPERKMCLQKRAP